ncbi:MAG: DsrE family protein [Alkalispirochaeta sp.]
MRKFALFAFNGDPMCFIHVLLNALDLKEKGHEVALVVEGSATRLVKLLSGGPGLEDFAEKNPPMHRLLSENFVKVQEAGLINCVCQACAQQMGALEDAKKVDLPLCYDLKGHPSMSRYIADGYEIISF